MNEAELGQRSTCRGRGHTVAASRKACWNCGMPAVRNFQCPHVTRNDAVGSDCGGQREASKQGSCCIKSHRDAARTTPIGLHTSINNIGEQTEQHNSTLRAVSHWREYKFLPAKHVLSHYVTNCYQYCRFYVFSFLWFICNTVAQRAARQTGGAVNILDPKQLSITEGQPVHLCWSLTSGGPCPTQNCDHCNHTRYGEALPDELAST